MIPKIIYLTYKDNNIPQKFIQRWKDLNRDYQVKFYNDKDCFDFINKYFGINYANYFSEIKIGPYKADFWRLCILYIKGGVYSDIDIVPIVKVDNIIENSDLCTCLAMNKKSIFQAFIASTSKNELIKLCLDSFYSQRNNKNFLKDLKDCSPTYDMYNVFCKYLNKYKIKPNKNYYINNQKIKILQEVGPGYLDAYVAFKGHKLLLSRDIDYVNHNNGKPWTHLCIGKEDIYPKGSYLETSKDLKLKKNILYLKCYNKDNNCISNKICIKKHENYHNLNGFMYIQKDEINDNYIPRDIYQSYPSNIVKKKGFNYYIYNNEEKGRFIEKYFPFIYSLYQNIPTILKKYIWALCIIYKNGGIYFDNDINMKNDTNKFIENSLFISNINKLKNINFDSFSSTKNNPLLLYIVKYFFTNINNVITKEKTIDIGSNTKAVKIIKIPGIIKESNISLNFQGENFKNDFQIKINSEKSLLYILRDEKLNGWEKELELKCHIKDYLSILTQGLEQYLLDNNYPILDDDNKVNYIYYDKNILNIFYNTHYSESL